MSEGYYAFSASTTNDELKIEERVSESADGQHWTFQSRRETFFSITIELNPDYGPSFTQAFKQAVILAGSEPSSRREGMSHRVWSKYSSGWNQQFFNQLRAVTSY